MSDTHSLHDLEIFTTCPQSKDIERQDYVRRAVDIAQWSEEFDCQGMLIYTDNGIIDPWFVAQIVIQNTRSLKPLVAVQPLYMHPYWLAKQVSSIAYLHDRPVALNMLAGGFKTDLLALGDDTPHDDRYLRTTEYTQIIRGLLEGGAPVDFVGKYYAVKKLKIAPPMPAELIPPVLMSGSSAAGLASCKAIGATAIRYPQPPESEAEERDAMATGVKCGARVGIIAREDSEEAWRVAYERFPSDHRGELQHKLATAVSDSVWHKQLSALGDRLVPQDSPYWLSPMKNYQTFCPYLVGSYSRVAEELGRYIALGFRTWITDIPPTRDELVHVMEVYRRAQSLALHVGRSGALTGIARSIPSHG
jgi:alkanesulfonate monooxygenase